jgi:hypothetical protein
MGEAGLRIRINRAPVLTLWAARRRGAARLRSADRADTALAATDGLGLLWAMWRLLGFLDDP